MRAPQLIWLLLVVLVFLLLLGTLHSPLALVVLILLGLIFVL